MCDVRDVKAEMSRLKYEGYVLNGRGVRNPRGGVEATYLNWHSANTGRRIG